MLTYNPQMTGRVHVIKHNASGEVVLDKKFDNHVLDSGMDFLITHMVGMTDYRNALAFQMNHLFLGSGTTEPAFSDTGLESRSGTLAGKKALSKSDDYVYSSTLPRVGHADEENHVYWTEITFNFQYAQGEAEGVWTELGLADDLSYTNPVTRALFRDENGDPISLTVLSDEYLTVFYTVRFEDGMGSPQTGTLDVSGQSVGYEVVQIKGNNSYSHTGWLSDYDGENTQYGNGYKNSGLWSIYFPFCAASPVIEALDPVPTGEIDVYTQTHTRSASYDAATKTISLQIVMEPTDADEAITGILFNAPVTGYYRDEGLDRGLYAIRFDTPFNKKADYRVTLDIDVVLGQLGEPVSGLVVSASTGSSLDFTWDAYPDATEYALVLRQAGTVIEEQTVTAPTTTASFTGLAASTEYHLDIQPKTSGRDGARSIHAATTGAA